MKRILCVMALTAATLLAISQTLGQQKEETESDSKPNKIISYFPVGKGKPSIPDKYKVTSIEQLLPGTRYYLEHATKIKKGEQVLIVTDSTVGDPLITEAWARAARERGA